MPARPAANSPGARDGGKGGWIMRAEEFIAPELSPDRGAAPGTGGNMGVIGKLLGGPGAVIGAGRGGEGRGRGVRALGHQADGAVGRGADGGPAAVGRGISAPGAGWFDRLVNGLNRLPRPLLAFGTLGLFIYAMIDPAGLCRPDGRR